jgi:hypothetical protein
MTHDVVASIGTYKDRQTGEEKKRYLTVGKYFIDDDGRQSIKLDALPVGPEWSGWLSLYPVKDRDGNSPRQSTAAPPARRETARTPEPSGGDEGRDETIPF